MTKPERTPDELEAMKLEKIEKQTNELMSKCLTEIQRYKGAAILVGAGKWTTKQAVLNVIEAFNESGGWQVTKTYDPVEGETVLRFKGIQGAPEFYG